jgi:hypothetical protein
MWSGNSWQGSSELHTFNEVNHLMAFGPLAMTVANACMMPVGFGVGNHQLFVIDFITTMLVGSGLHAIVRPALHQLNTKIEGCAQQYNKTLQLRKNILQHPLLERIVAAASSAKSKEAISAKLNKLDK